MDTAALKRLEIKTDQQTLIMELQRDYRLSPVESKVLFTRLQEYVSSHQDDYLADGQIIYPAVAFSDVPIFWVNAFCVFCDIDSCVRRYNHTRLENSGFTKEV